MDSQHEGVVLVQARADDGAHRLHDLLGASDVSGEARVVGVVLVDGAVRIVGVAADPFLEIDVLDLFECGG